MSFIFEQLELITEFRKKNQAPIDTENFVSLSQSDDPKTFRFTCLVSLIISTNTRQSITAKTIKKLQSLPGGLNPKSILNTNPLHIKEILKGVNLSKRKSEFLMKLAGISLRDYNGDIPSSIEELVQIDGVGLKLANLAMRLCWKIGAGIGVDQNIHRVANLLQWVKTTSPEKTETQLQLIFPKDKWEEIGKNSIGFGQLICKKANPKCDECPLKASCPCL